MKLHTKLAILPALCLLLSSCTSYLTMAKNETITEDYLSQLRVNKRYKFELATGSTLRVRVDSIKNEKLYGHIFQSGEVFMSRKNPFSDPLENLDANVIKISRRKFNPFLTTLAVGVPKLIVIICTARYGVGFNSNP